MQLFFGIIAPDLPDVHVDAVIDQRFAAAVDAVDDLVEEGVAHTVEQDAQADRPGMGRERFGDRVGFVAELLRDRPDLGSHFRVNALAPVEGSVDRSAGNIGCFGYILDRYRHLLQTS